MAKDKPSMWITPPGAGRLTAPARPRPVRQRRMKVAQVPIPDQTIGALAVIQGLQAELVDRLERLADNPVLMAGSYVIPAEGFFVRNFDVLYQSVLCVNLAATALTVASGGGTDPARPPTIGAGVNIVGIGKAAMCSMKGNAVTVYGTPGAAFGLTVLSRWVPPSVA